MRHNPLDTDAVETAQKDASDKQKLSARIEKDDLVWMMGNKRGRRVLYRILERAGVWRLSFNTNAMQMAFNEGMRNEGLALTAKIMGYCSEQYTLMVTENRELD